MGAVADRSAVDLEWVREEAEEDLEDFSDSRVNRLIAEAKEAADLFMSNPFLPLDEDGLQVEGETRPIPPTVERGVVEWVRGRATALQVAQGVASEGVGGMNRSYTATASEGDWASAAEALWAPYRLGHYQ